MNRLARPLLSLCALLGLPSCADDDRALTRHEICVRMSTAACDRAAVCDPTVSADGCFARVMDRCCPDGVCDEPVIATEPRMEACEQAIASMSCSDLEDGDRPASCEDLDDPLPQPTPPDAGPSPGDGDPAPDPAGTGVLDLSWWISAGGTSISCAAFYGATTLRVHATDASGTLTTREFPCSHFGAVTSLPVGVYSVRAELLAGTQLVQQTAASSVYLDASGATRSFTFTVNTRLGAYCQQLGATACAACLPDDTSCETEFYNACCGNEGTCNNPALAQPSAFSACLGAYDSGQYCTTSPPQCSGIVTVW